MESALIISPSNFRASSRAVFDLPAAVGPRIMTRRVRLASLSGNRSCPPEHLLNFPAGKTYEHRAPVGAVRSEGDRIQVPAQGVYLLLRHFAVRLDCGTAGKESEDVVS